MAGALLPVVTETGPFAGSSVESASAAAAAVDGSSSGRQELAVPACSGAVALRRATSLLSAARRADAQGDHQQARELYTEVLKVQKSLARAPLGSIGKSLRDVAVGVEARLQHLREAEAQQQAPGGVAASSRPGTSSNAAPSSSSTAVPSAAAGGPAGGAGDDDAAGGNVGGASETSAAALPDCPVSARNNCADRPTTRDGTSLRPCTQDGKRPGTMDGGFWRPTTRDGSSRQSSLDGMRPSTRDGQRLQQMIDGGGGHRHRGASRGHGSRGPPKPGDGSDSVRDRDGVRPATRSGPEGVRVSVSRGQDVSIRQVHAASRMPSGHGKEKKEQPSGRGWRGPWGHRVPHL
mmetsp:Transcript_159992/g.513333  ORF Transcript_159992/g.513333 Transcript_159992/m.513333 type:complete len:349 (-) Transcript_159992:130-1176(-)